MQEKLSVELSRVGEMITPLKLVDLTFDDWRCTLL